jgi:hypothetical protein
VVDVRKLSYFSHNNVMYRYSLFIFFVIIVVCLVYLQIIASIEHLSNSPAFSKQFCQPAPAPAPAGTSSYFSSSSIGSNRYTANNSFIRNEYSSIPNVVVKNLTETDINKDVRAIIATNEKITVPTVTVYYKTDYVAVWTGPEISKIDATIKERIKETAEFVSWCFINIYTGAFKMPCENQDILFSIYLLNTGQLNPKDISENDVAVAYGGGGYMAISLRELSKASEWPDGIFNIVAHEMAHSFDHYTGSYRPFNEALSNFMGFVCIEQFKRSGQTSKTFSRYGLGADFKLPIGIFVSTFERSTVPFDSTSNYYHNIINGIKTPALDFSNDHPGYYNAWVPMYYLYITYGLEFIVCLRHRLPKENRDYTYGTKSVNGVLKERHIYKFIETMSQLLIESYSISLPDFMAQYVIDTLIAQYFTEASVWNDSHCKIRNDFKGMNTTMEWLGFAAFKITGTGTITWTVASNAQSWRMICVKIKSKKDTEQTVVDGRAGQMIYNTAGFSRAYFAAVAATRPVNPNDSTGIQISFV